MAKKLRDSLSVKSAAVDPDSLKTAKSAAIPASEVPTTKSASTDSRVPKASPTTNSMIPKVNTDQELESMNLDYVPEIKDEQAVQEQEVSAVDKIDGWVNKYPNLFAGGSALLVGALMGDIPTAAGVAGNQILSEYNKDADLDREKELLQFKASRGISGSGNTTPQKIVGEDGKVRYAYDRKDIEGKQAGYSTSDLGLDRARLANRRESNVLEGKNITFKPDDQGRMSKYDRITGEVTPINIAGLSPKQIDRAERVTDKFNKEVAPLKETISDAESAIQNLADKNQLSNKLAFMEIVKTVEQRLSDQDRNYYQQEISDMRKLRERKDLINRNELNPRLVQESLRMINRGLAKARKRYQEKRGTYSSQLEARDFPKDRVDSIFGKGLGKSGTLKMYKRVKSGIAEITVPYDQVGRARKEGFSTGGN